MIDALLHAMSQEGGVLAGMSCIICILFNGCPLLIRLLAPGFFGRRNRPGRGLM